MSFIEAVICLLEETEMPDDEKSQGRAALESLKGKVTVNPREENHENNLLLRVLACTLLYRLEELYGPVEVAKLHHEPVFWENFRSQVVVLQGDEIIIGMAITVLAKSWEHVFYEMCHESVHLLNPRINAQKERVSALEEGVAVKFAEQMYAEHISPYTNQLPAFSPTQQQSSQYFVAFQAAEKIPDSVLRDVRTHFKSFSEIDNLDEFKSFVLSHISEDEAVVLYSPFVY